MTVSELIEELKQLPAEALVLIQRTDEYDNIGYGPPDICQALEEVCDTPGVPEILL